MPINAVILRRRKLGKGSARGIIANSGGTIMQARTWVPRDMRSIPTTARAVIRWGCTAPVGDRYELTLNSAQSISFCNNKVESRIRMQEAGVPVPTTFRNSDLLRGDRFEDFNRTSRYVVRPARHAQGRRLYVASGNEVDAVIRRHGLQDGYTSLLIDKVAEYRVFVAQNRVVWVARKTPGNPTDVAWNVARGGRFDNVRWADWPIEVCKAALAAAKVTGTDFCGVDVMVGRDNKPYVLEANSAPSQTSPYRQQCTTDALLYMIANGKDPFPDPERIKTFRPIVHPAVRERFQQQENS